MKTYLIYYDNITVVLQVVQYKNKNLLLQHTVLIYLNQFIYLFALYRFVIIVLHFSVNYTQYQYHSKE